MPMDELGSKVLQKPPPTHARDAQVQFRQAAFLGGYIKTGRVGLAAEIAGVDRSTHYGWLDTDLEYVEAYRRAHLLAISAAEDECYRRAVEGVITKRTVAGEAVDVREFSDNLLMFWLKGHKREVYGDKRELSGKDGGPVAITFAAVDELIARGLEREKAEALEAAPEEAQS